MNNPIAKLTRFNEKTVVLNEHKDQNNNESDYDDYLISPSPEEKRRREKERRAKLITQENQIKLKKMDVIPNEQCKRGEILKDNSGLRKLKDQFSEYLKQRQEEERKQFQQANMKQNELKQKQEQELKRLELSKIKDARPMKQIENSKLKTQVKFEIPVVEGPPSFDKSSTNQIQGFIPQNQRIGQLPQEESNKILPLVQDSMDIESNITDKHNPIKKKQRVTMKLSDWFQFISGQASDRPKQVEKKDFQIETIKLPPRHSINKRSSDNLEGRITMDLKAIASMIEKNFAQYQDLSKNSPLQKQQLARPSISRRQSMSNTNNENTALVDNFFNQLSQRKQVLQREKADLDQLDQQLNKTLEWLEQKHRNIQSLAKKQKQRLSSEIGSLDQSTDADYSNSLLNYQTFEQLMLPISFFHYKYGISINTFMTRNTGSQYALDLEFIIDEDFFCKVRRINDKDKAEIRIKPSSRLELFGRQWTLDEKLRVELIKLFFASRLQYLDGSSILKELGDYYQRINDVETDIELLSAVFTTEDFEINSSYDSLSFKIQIKPSVNFAVNIQMVKLKEDVFFQLYHMEAGNEVVIPANLIGKQCPLLNVMSILIDSF